MKTLALLLVGLVLGFLVTYVFFPRKTGLDGGPNGKATKMMPVMMKGDGIEVSDPKGNDLVTSPLTVTGRAKGMWFFEASFPVTLTDSEGTEIVSSYAQAQGEWMTEDYVDFESLLEFDTPSDPKGYIVLRADNPSGMPENDKELKIPVRFK
ncbi:hypothetical protein A2716_00510 [candidate division WWE3 bacterium RIFCSPHIGHO2_01_FULL_40_23]|uniref:Bacterial spore germination immunoglobulin-like domain-containing protein n=1 Tax=candidate division WWE3 bacterium RIFCSPLOWO2_01_FULL_41_18 TaxID=1802625 RepID=A0A1F4VE61_UNCKA|nr:MAG: hypothetical protein A2716_00510 [candidate division WWE3 bacterium RIFCSPHIGHO2_01_FULL_40_23]OGC55477.1 MAG: hypothetical protein A3A78_00780 [candidate division WWE3 bacterium RIFCSPLOWO2_01_FULL_41_18]